MSGVFFFRMYMLAQSYTPNLYTLPLYRNYFIILSLLFPTVSMPIRSEPRIYTRLLNKSMVKHRSLPRHAAANRESGFLA